MLFITLYKFKKKPTKEIVGEIQKGMEQRVKEGVVKVLGLYWTLGRYDAVLVSEAPDEKTHMKNMLRWADLFSSESLVAVRAEEASKLLE